LGLEYKTDVPGPCWVTWDGTWPGGVRLIRLQQAADEAALDNPPSDLFEPVRPGVNEMRFADEPEPELPPGPSPPDSKPEDPELPSETAQVDAVVYWRRHSTPLIVEGAISLALDDDLMDFVVDATVYVAREQKERDENA